MFMFEEPIRQLPGKYQPSLPGDPNLQLPTTLGAPRVWQLVAYISPLADSRLAHIMGRNPEMSMSFIPDGSEGSENFPFPDFILKKTEN